MESLGAILFTSMTFFSDASGAVVAMREYVAPTIKVLASLASIASVFFIVHAGYLYMTSSGKPEQLDQAKRVMKNAVLGLVIVLAAVTITSILSGAYGTPQNTAGSTLPNLQAIQPSAPNNALEEMFQKTVRGFLNNVVQTIGTPFLGALDFFTKSTPLMAQNPSVFNFWLAMVGIADVLFVIIIALLGFHVMSASTFGFDEVELKHLLPRIALIFLLMNTSIFFIDGIIALSNALVAAVGKISGASTVWGTLTEVLKEASVQSIAALLMMMAFLIFAIFLLVFYVARMVTLFIGAVLSPIVALIWLVPGFRDFAETALKTYIVTIFTLFVHVVILQIASSLLTGVSATSGNNLPDTFMAMIVGLATILTMLKAQSVMMQFSYVSMGARNMRKLGGQLINGISHLTHPKKKDGDTKSSTSSGSQKSVQDTVSRRNTNTSTGKNPRTTDRGVKVTRVPEATTKKTGSTAEAPRATPIKTNNAAQTAKGEKS